MNENTQKDKTVREEILARLEKDKLIDISKIKANVQNGIVTIEGSLNSLWQKIRIERLVNLVEGVEDIINRILILPKRSAIIRDLMSEDLSDDRLIHIVEAHLSKLEIYFGMAGTLITMGLLAIAVLLTPNYNPLYNTVSSLGEGIARTIFSIAFVIAGSTGIPLLLYLEKMLVGLNEFIRRIATGTAVLTSLCIALVGILPDPDYYNNFLLFHGFVAIFAFIGSGIYISLYSYLMMKSKAYKTYHVIIGFLTGINLILLLIFFNPLVEWILTINIFVWVLITTIELFYQ